MLKRLVLVLALVAASLVGASSTASQGVTVSQLMAAGWQCFDVPGPLGVHCAAPGKTFPPTGAVVQLLYFDTQDVNVEGAFLGTETLIRADIFLRAPDRPCPRQDDPGAFWFPIDFGPSGVYYACHHR